MSPTNGRSAKRATSVLGLLSRFAQAEGLGPNPPLSAQVIEAFCVGGLRGLGSATKGTYRSVLRDLAGGPTPALATPFSASGASVPYTSAERAELVAMASAQRRPWKRHSALALLGMCLGAGARAGEAVGALGTDVDADTARITLRAKGGTLRQVPLSAPYAGIVCRRAEVVGGGHLFHPEPGDRGYPNFVNYFCAHLDGAGPALSLRRCRASFICDLLAQGVARGTIVELAGIAQVESLLGYCRHVSGAPASKAALRALATHR